MDCVGCSKKHQTRFLKKLSKSKAKLKNEGLVISDEPTSCIIICNAGIGNGMRRRVLEDLIIKFEKLEMPANKPYAVVSLMNCQDALSVMRKLQGYILRAEENLTAASTTFYVHFIKDFRTPEKSINSWNYLEVSGLKLFENFISESEESLLIEFLQMNNPITTKKNTSNVLKNRQVWHYGYEFRYKHNDVDLHKPIKDALPDVLKDLIVKMMNQQVTAKEPDQITVNKYEPGHGIPPHIDNPEAFDDTLASLSLGSHTVMDFRRNEQHVQVLLRQRSLLSFTGESRYRWTHGICPRKVDLVPTRLSQGLTPVNRATRYSVTFRKVREDYNGPMTSFPQQKGDIDHVASLPSNEKEAVSLEELHVQKVYDEIASHFSATRKKPWPQVVRFIESLEPYSLILDVGCGSGRYFGTRSDVCMVGCDRSAPLTNICKEKGYEVITCDGLNLPLKGEIYDACICIAVIHHYSTVERRHRAIEQLLRVTRPGGKILLTVWAQEQEFKGVKSKYLKPSGHHFIENPPYDDCSSQLRSDDRTSHQKERNPPQERTDRLPVHKNKTLFQQQDVLVPWHRKPIKSESSSTVNPACNEHAKTFHRYYHVFKNSELMLLCQKFDHARIVERYYDEGNWCVVLKKL